MKAKNSSMTKADKEDNQKHLQFMNDLASVTLLGKEDMKRSVLLKRRMMWQGENPLERLSQRKKVLVNQGKAQRDLKEISCPICMEVLVKSTTTVCGHCFCERCIFESLLRKSQCPICRTTIKNHQFLFSQVLDKQILQILTSNEDQSHLKMYEERIKDHDTWNISRRAFVVEVGTQLDVLDNEQIWCVGNVLQVIKCHNDKQILVRYDAGQQTSDEFISANSYRLAPKGFFTGRADLPQHSQYNMFSYLILHDNEEEDTSRNPNFDVIDLISILFRPRLTQVTQPE